MAKFGQTGESSMSSNHNLDPKWLQWSRQLMAIAQNGLRSKHCNAPPLPFHIYKLFILCELLGGDAATSHETDEVAFFPENGLPELSLTRTTPALVARLFEHLRCPGLPPDFD